MLLLAVAALAVATTTTVGAIPDGAGGGGAFPPKSLNVKMGKVDAQGENFVLAEENHALEAAVTGVQEALGLAQAELAAAVAPKAAKPEPSREEQVQAAVAAEEADAALRRPQAPTVRMLEAEAGCEYQTGQKCNKKEDTFKPWGDRCYDQGARASGNHCVLATFEHTAGGEGGSARLPEFCRKTNQDFCRGGETWCISLDLFVLHSKTVPDANWCDCSDAALADAGITNTPCTGKLA